MREDLRSMNDGKCSVALVPLILAAMGAVIWWLSANAVWVCDSVSYQYDVSSGEKIGTLGQLFSAQYVYYFTSNGRFVAHLICRWYLAVAGHTWFGVCNALMYILYVLVIARYTGLRLRDSRQVLLAVLLVLFFCDTDYAPNCQVGYVWMYTFTLVYLLAFFNGNCVKVRNPLLLFLMFVLSAVIGNGHETLNIGVGGALCIYVVTHIRQLTPAQWVMLVGFGIGGLALCLSPASIGRASGSQQMPLMYSLVQILTSLRAFYLLVILILVRMARGRFDARVWYRSNAFDVNVLAVTIAFNLCLGVSVPRQLLGVELMSAVITLRMLAATRLSGWWLGFAAMVVGALYTMKAVEEVKAKDAYSALVAAVMDHPGDVIYADFPQYSGVISPTTPMRYGHYDGYVLWSALVDVYGYNHRLHEKRMYPTALRDVLERSVPVDTVIEYQPGEYFLAVPKGSAAKATLHRAVELFGVGIPIPDAYIDINRDNCVEEGQYLLLCLPNILPLVRNTGVEIDAK